MSNVRRSLGWALPACLICSSLALHAVDAGPNMRKVKFGCAVRLDMVDSTPRKFPLGRLNVLDSAGNPVKDAEGDKVFFAGDGKTLDSIESTPVVLAKGEYWFQVLPADAKSPNWEFELSIKTPAGKASGKDDKAHFGGKYVLQVKRSGPSDSDVQVKGDWMVQPGANAEKVTATASANAKQTMLELR